MNKTFGILAMLVMGVALASGVSAFGGDFMGAGKGQEVNDALANRDYDAFLSAMSVSKEEVAERISQERFLEMADKFSLKDSAEKAIEDGDYNAWLESVSGMNGRMSATEEDFQRMAEMHKTQDEIKMAIENRDYQAWSDAVSKSMFEARMLDYVNEENFNTFIDMYNARISGDFEVAQELAKELGIECPMKGLNRGFGMPKHSRRGF